MTDRPEPLDADLLGLPIRHDAENFRAREPLEILVTRFTEAVRRGERPSVDEYAARYSEWADKIREVFPLIASLEGWKLEMQTEGLRRSVPQAFPVQRLGDYRLERELGRGGMGVVFEAVEERTGRRRALKVLPWRFAADMQAWQDRFQREASTIARLQHSHIVRVYSFGMQDGYCYYVMDLIDGVSLDWVISRLREAGELRYAENIVRRSGDLTEDFPDGPAPDDAVLRRDSWREFARFGVQVALALAHAHEQGVMHNDIKPGNLLLQADGRVIVTDFGIGRRREGDPDGDEHGTGTLRYMPPERLTGRGDVRSDLYSLGVTLYELMLQTPAFATVDRRELRERIARAELPRPRLVQPRLPRPLQTILLNALAPDPSDRYSSAAALAADLQRFLDGLPIRRTRPGWWGRAFRRWRGEDRPGSGR